MGVLENTKKRWTAQCDLSVEICHEKKALGPEKARPGQSRPGQGGLAVYMFLSNARLKQVDEVRV